MDRATLVTALASVLMGAVAQIVLKAGMSTPAVIGALSRGAGMPLALTAASSPLVWLGLAIYGASAVVWLLVLAKVEVSLAYPLVGAGFVMTMLLAWLVQGEHPSAIRIVGTLLVATGVVLVSRS